MMKYSWLFRLDSFHQHGIYLTWEYFHFIIFYSTSIKWRFQIRLYDVTHNDDYEYNYITSIKWRFQVYNIPRQSNDDSKYKYITRQSNDDLFLFIFHYVLGFSTQESTVTAPNYVANIDWKIQHYIRICESCTLWMV